MSVKKMRDDQKNKAELLQEVQTLRNRVTELQQIEEVLRESEQKWRSLLENTPDIVMIVDRDGTIRFINHTAPSFKIKETIGRKLYDYVQPEHYDTVRRDLEKVFQTGYSTNHEISRVGRNGELSWYQAEIGPIKQGGHIVAASIIARDITEHRRDEDALRESRHRFRSLVEVTSDWVWEVDENGIYTYASPKVKELLGYEPEEIIGKTPFDLMPPDEAEHVGAIFRDITISRKPFERLENRNLHKDGRLIMLETSGVPILDEGGNLLGYRGIDRDVTERKRAEEALRLRNVAIESSINGVAFVDLEGNLFYANDSFLKLWGYNDEKQVLGKPAVGFWADVSKAAEIREVVNKKGGWTGELVAKRKDGSNFDVELSASLVKDENANPVCSMASFVDITERKNTEQSLRESEERLRAALSAAQMGTWRWDPATNQDTRGASFNRILGLEAVESTQPVEDFLRRVHPKDREMVDAEIQHSLREHCTYLAEFRIIRPDGTVRWLRDQGRPLYGENDQLLYLTGAVVDITEYKKAEKKLIQSKAITDSINEALILFDMDGTTSFVNPEYERITGYTSSEIVGKNGIEVAEKTVRPDELEKVLEAFDRSLKGEILKPMSTVLVNKNGKETQIEFTPSFVKDDKGKSIQIIAAISDITERKQAEDALRESEKRFRGIFENTAVGVYRTTPDGQILMANPALVHMLGYSSFEELSKRNLEEGGFEPQYQRSMFKEEIERKGRIVGLESTWITRDGKKLHVIENVRAVRDEDDEILYYEGTAENITERKRAEEALRESENRYRTLFNDIADPIFVADFETGILIDCNRAASELVGREKSELIGKHQRTLHPPKETEGEFSRTFEQHCKEKRGQVLKAQVITKKGVIRDVAIRADFAELEGNKRILFGMFRDITEHNQALEELNEYREKMAHAERLASLGTLSATLAHELNQPLTAIRLSIENSLAGLETTSGPDTVIEDLKDGLSAVSDVASKVNVLRDFAQKSSKEIISEVNLKAVAERILNLLNESARRAKVTLQLEGMEELPHIRSNEKDLEQLFFALVENAIEAADGKKIRRLIISADVKGGNIELRFADDCCGITSENLDKIFEPFFTTRPRSEGTGLGLCIAERIVSGAGGKIRVESKAGKGSSFFVTLPINRGGRS